MPERSLAKPYVALTLVQLFFATMGVAGKIALRELSPLVLASVRVVAGAAALWILARVLAAGERPGRREVLRFAAVGLFGVFLNQALFISGLAYTTATNAVLLVATIPAFTYLFSVLAGDQRAEARHVAGLAVSFAGVAIVVGAGEVTRESLLGDALVLLNAAAYGWSLVLARPLVARHSPSVVVAWSFLFGALGILLISAPQIVATDWAAISSATWWTVAFIVAIPTVGSYSLNNYALRHLPSRTVAAFIYLQPIGGAALAVWILDEVVGPGTIVGAALVFVGIGLVMRGR